MIIVTITYQPDSFKLQFDKDFYETLIDFYCWQTHGKVKYDLIISNLLSTFLFSNFILHSTPEPIWKQYEMSKIPLPIVHATNTHLMWTKGISLLSTCNITFINHSSLQRNSLWVVRSSNVFFFRERDRLYSLRITILKFLSFFSFI